MMILNRARIHQFKTMIIFNLSTEKRCEIVMNNKYTQIGTF